ncbi:MAG: M48 family metallopeptidase [Treponema sp.]|nr:M48 family metallopeptidase [Treponema sp.]
MKCFKKPLVVFFIILIFSGCASNPLTGKKTMAFVDNRSLFPQSFAEYRNFLNENDVIKNTPEAEMVERVGQRMAEAARKWLEREGYASYLDAYEWEFNLVRDDAVNAWCMPGGKIVFYTGILPITQTEAGLAVVMGHEITHALLNHGQQRVSAGLLQQIGAVGVAILASGGSEQTQSLAMGAYSLGSTFLGTMPFGREHESEADRYGLILMAIAGYNPEESVPFWQRMAAQGGGGTPEFLSTHPSSATRIRQLQGWIPEAKETAATFGVRF